MQFNPYYLYSLMRTLMLGVIVVLCFTEVLIASAVNAQLLHKKVTLDVHDGSIAEAVKSLEAKNILIAYDAAKYNLDNRKINSRRFVSKPIRDVLTYIFNGTDLGFRETGAYIILEKIVPQRPGRISGTVYDERGLPLIGASVKVLGNKTVQTGIDGTYNMELPAGTYVVEVSYISYKTQRVQAIKVAAGQRAALDVAMEISSERLEDVVVTTTFKKASVAGLYAAQKNAASVTDGISAEQIARTPDNDMGAALKRITGLTTVNNRNVIVRGMSDRYNQAMLDGVSIPSTSMNRRDFSFDIIPTEMVSSVVVNKTATPDVSSEFSGGQVSVNTLDIPEQNFTNIQIGSGFNSQSIGKDFYRLGERHTSEYFGFLDKSAKQPEGILSWRFPGDDPTPPPGNANTGDRDLIPGNGIPYSSLDAVAQSKKLSAEPLVLHRYNGKPNQNYRLSLGRVYDFKNGMRFGFSAAASLRSEQQVFQFNNVRGSNYGDVPIHFIDSTKIGQNGAGTSYRFNSNSGLAANLGLQGDKFKIALKNMYARTYSDNYNEAIRLNYGDLTLEPNREQYQLPEAMSLQQHQLSGEYQLPWDVKASGMFAYNKIIQRIQDERKMKYRLTTQIGDQYYFQSPNVGVPGRSDSALELDSRMWTHVNEADFNWAANFSKSFASGETLSTLVKLGYQGFDKRRDLSVLRMIPYAAPSSNFEKPYDVILDPANMGTGVNEAYYWAMHTNGSVFDGEMKSHAVYLMADQKLWNRLRLVYGLRGESFDLDNSQEELLDRQYEDTDGFIAFRRGVKESGWRWLPSINATYEVTSRFNVRSSYSRTIIRPDFRESSFFGFYDYDLDGNVSGDRVESTLVDNVDLRLELYPGAGEIVSLTGYYKFLDRPIELIRRDEFQSPNYAFANMESATNLGLEMEVRKNLGFLSDQDWWENVFVYGNGTLLKSEVKVMTGWIGKVQEDSGEYEFRQEKGGIQDRPLIGQSPWLLNLGLGYWGETFGLTASYNQRGYRTNLTATNPNAVEYENTPGQFDGQLYARLLNKRMELKFNMANLLNKWTIYYANTQGFNRNPEDLSEWIPNKGDNKYNKEDNDTIMYRRKEGQRFSLSLTYNF